MNRSALLTSLFGLFIIETGGLFSVNGAFMVPGFTWKIGFFILLPLILAVFIWLRFRWAAMACVIYATVGLAMDLATIVQLPTQGLNTVHPLLTSGISGLFNFFVIMFGGRWLLDVG